ncbi:MAG: GNAT family N-acetyltransferase [Flavobacteriales bacterium]
MQGTIHVSVVSGAADMRSYLRLSGILPDQRPNRVPLLRMDEREFHDPKRNPQLAHCEVRYWLARRDGVPVGRVMGIIHRQYNQACGELTARFYDLVCIRDRDTVLALLEAVEQWAMSAGMDRIIGPFGFSDKDPQGLQIEGFEQLPVIATPINPDWLPPLVEACGYAPFEDMVSYRMDIPAQLPEVYHAIGERCLRNFGLHRVPLRSKRELKPWVVPVLRLVNATYGDLLGFTPMSEAEMRALAAKYMFILDPQLVHLIADAHNEPVAFVIASPDMSEGFVRANGSLFPFGFLHILRAMKRSKQLDLLLGAVRPDLQGKGLTAALGVSLFSAARARGFTHLDSHLIMERNTRMRAELERLGAVVWKRYRVYQKGL